jgi:glucose-6-phosphate dehydrogenase assembly protein OpcA
MEKQTLSKNEQIPIETTLDFETVEHQLNELWMKNAGASGVDDEGAMLRARVLNLMVYITDEGALGGVDEILMDLALVHPCRALVIIADAAGEDRDIEMDVSSRCQIGRGAGGQHLCCEEVTLRAKGRYTVELPSACLPLLVSDLPVFLCWRAPMQVDDQIFQSLLKASDRVVIDTAFCSNPLDELRALAQLLQRQRKERQGISDLNWSRLTAWRTLLASFYDTPEHATSLAGLSGVRIDYVAPESAGGNIAPKALLLVGWLASRLGWRAANDQGQPAKSGAHTYFAEKDGRTIGIEFRASKHKAVKPGGIVSVELMVTDTGRRFLAMRAEDGRDFETREATESEVGTTRVVSGLDKTDAQLHSAELEILSHDQIYEEAVVKAVELFTRA